MKGSKLKPSAFRNQVPVRLLVFVAGSSGASVRFLANLERFKGRHAEVAFSVEVFDVLKKPEAALEHQVLVTPFLIRKFPEPELRIAGDLTRESDLDAIVPPKASDEEHT